MLRTSLILLTLASTILANASTQAEQPPPRTAPSKTEKNADHREAGHRETGPQGSDLQILLAAEKQRIDTMAKVAPSVCSVMQLKSPGGGSGVIFDPSGFIVTNFHVVGKPTVRRMKIGLPDGNLYKATVLGIDPGSDLAVLILDPRKDGKPWPYSKFGDSDDLLVGEMVFAMGNPFLLATDFSPTVTWGLVSGIHRYQQGKGNRYLVYPDCIQVDAPVNPGNSGGPLFNRRGEVVGINGRISIRDRGRVNVGVGFAIASNQIRNFLGELMAGKHAEHGTLDLNTYFMTAPNDPSRRGVFVQALFEDSVARDLGLQLGDEITTLNGIKINSANQMATIVGVLPAGAWVNLGYRPQREQNGYGDEILIDFPMRRLDTGSSRTPDRIASKDHRAIAMEAVTRSLDPKRVAKGASLVMTGPKKERLEISRLGDKLRLDYSDYALVRTGPKEGFKIDRNGQVSELSEAEHKKLDVVLQTNPWLWQDAGLLTILEDALLDGTTMIYGRPAFRLALAGEGDRQLYLFEDGTVAGCEYHDPVQDAKIELRRLGDRCLIIKSGELKPGWTISRPQFTAPPSSKFARPTR